MNRSSLATLLFSLSTLLSACAVGTIDPPGTSKTEPGSGPGSLSAASPGGLDAGGTQDGATREDSTREDGTREDGMYEAGTYDGGSASDAGGTADTSAATDTSPGADTAPSGDPAPSADASTSDTSTTTADSGHDHDSGTDTGSGSAADTSTPPPPPPPPPADSGVAISDAPTGAPTAAALLAVTATCTLASTGRYSTDSGFPATVDICSLPGAFFWNADMDVDCDGKKTTVCNASTDPSFQNMTSATDSSGGWLDASTLPYVVIPLPSSRFDYKAAGIGLGDVVAVIYAGKVQYGVFGDEGPSDIIGESSYAMASSLGIDPNPATGGVDSGVTYIVFPGSASKASPIEDHATAVAVGEALAATLVK